MKIQLSKICRLQEKQCLEEIHSIKTHMLEKKKDVKSTI